MALVKDNLWGIVGDGAAVIQKYMARRDRALAIVVLAVEPSLLYLLEDPETVWDKLQNQFQKKTWWNKLYSLKLRKDGSVTAHLKIVTEIFDSLAIMGGALSEEDKVGFLLASLPDSFGHCTARTAPGWDLMTQRLLIRQKDRGADTEEKKALLMSRPHTFNPQRKARTLHVTTATKRVISRKNVESWLEISKAKNNPKCAASIKTDGYLAFDRALCAKADPEGWIIDSGATCHMTN